MFGTVLFSRSKQVYNLACKVISQGPRCSKPFGLLGSISSHKLFRIGFPGSLRRSAVLWHVGCKRALRPRLLLLQHEGRAARAPEGTAGELWAGRCLAGRSRGCRSPDPSTRLLGLW